MEKVGIVDEPVLEREKNFHSVIKNEDERSALISSVDSLGISTHAYALAHFIKSTQTPMTIGVQGEWGSGKTSLLNTIYQILGSNQKYRQIWINSWEHSLLSSPEESLLKITNEIIAEMLSADISKERKERVTSYAKRIFSGALRVSANVALGSAGDRLADGVLNTGERTISIKELRNELAGLTEEIMERDTNPFDKVIIYIDDLDRIEPKNAVQLLELLKNIFSIPGCVFVLAIDYQVVVKGLEHKFGRRTAENEWEFRAFFDKIIQLPFMMPLGQYDIGSYVNSLLENIGFVKKDLLDSDDLHEIVSQSIGGNPRSLKRLANSLSLIHIFSSVKNEVNSQEKIKSTLDEKSQKLLLFTLICIQIAYPEIYDRLVNDPDFENWDDEWAFGITNQKEEEDSKFSRQFEIATKTEDFDEEWEKALYRVCFIAPRYRVQVVPISRLLSKIKDEILADQEKNGPALANILSQTAVTSINSSDESQAIKKISGRKTGEFGVEINGHVFSEKSLSVLFRQVLEYLVDNNLLNSIQIPWGESKSRIILTNDPNPIHPNGRAYFVPIEYKGYTLEAHYSRDKGLAIMKKLCNDIGVSFKLNN